MINESCYGFFLWCVHWTSGIHYEGQRKRPIVSVTFFTSFRNIIRITANAFNVTKSSSIFFPGTGSFTCRYLIIACYTSIVSRCRTPWLSCWVSVMETWIEGVWDASDDTWTRGVRIYSWETFAIGIIQTGGFSAISICTNGTVSLDTVNVAWIGNITSYRTTASYRKISYGLNILKNRWLKTKVF